METPRLSGLLRERGAGLIEVIRFWRAATVRGAVRVPAAFRDGAGAWRWVRRAGAFGASPDLSCVREGGGASPVRPKRARRAARLAVA